MGLYAVTRGFPQCLEHQQANPKQHPRKHLKTCKWLALRSWVAVMDPDMWSMQQRVYRANVLLVDTTLRDPKCIIVQYIEGSCTGHAGLFPVSVSMQGPVESKC